jgi:hypothetical protein
LESPISQDQSLELKMDFGAIPDNVLLARIKFSQPLSTMDVFKHIPVLTDTPSFVKRPASSRMLSTSTGLAPERLYTRTIWNRARVFACTDDSDTIFMVAEKSYKAESEATRNRFVRWSEIDHRMQAKAHGDILLETAKSKGEDAPGRLTSKSQSSSADSDSEKEKSLTANTAKASTRRRRCRSSTHKKAVRQQPKRSVKAKTPRGSKFASPPPTPARRQPERSCKAKTPTAGKFNFASPLTRARAARQAQKEVSL